MYGYRAYDANLFIACIAILHYYSNLLSSLSELGYLRLLEARFFSSEIGEYMLTQIVLLKQCCFYTF